jgi:hypothetical protein
VLDGAAMASVGFQEQQAAAALSQLTNHHGVCRLHQNTAVFKVLVKQCGRVARNGLQRKCTRENGEEQCVEMSLSIA